MDKRTTSSSEAQDVQMLSVQQNVANLICSALQKNSSYLQKRLRICKNVSQTYKNSLKVAKNS